MRAAVLLAAGLALLAGAAVLAALLWGGIVRLERAHRRKATTWRVDIRPSLFGLAVGVVREEAGVETGRVLVQRIPSSAPDWPARYRAAVAEAARRVEALRSRPDPELEAVMDEQDERAGQRT